MAGVVTAPAATARPHWDRLRHSLHGQAILPGDPGYQTAAQLQLAQFDHIRPAAIVYAHDAADVATTLRFVAEEGIPFAPRGGGHSYAGYSTTTGLVLDLSRLNSVSSRGEIADIGAGTTQVDADAALTKSGYAVPGAQCGTVSLGGMVPCGGIGWWTRRDGLTSDRLLGAEVVLADGSVVWCDEHREPDLFWALRGGGGGNFGVVTRLRLRAIKAHDVTSFQLSWPWRHAEQVLSGWSAWVEHSGQVGTVVNIAVEDGADPQVYVTGGAQGDVTAVLDRLVDTIGVPPAQRVSQTTPYLQAMLGVFGCDTVAACRRVGTAPGAQLPRYAFALSKGDFQRRPLSGAVVRDVLNALADGRPEGHSRGLFLQSTGGMMNEVAAGATAFPHRDTLYYLAYSVGIERPRTQADERAAHEWIAAAAATARRNTGSGGGYLGFIDPTVPDWTTQYYAGNHARLRSVREHYDPHRLFRLPRSV